ncbi:hypothetical protein CK516_12620 [Nostoc sp. 'Peltigera malacea cyanobiont' DB3992]|nr:hypothetical protein CK516_12620 [Nostoc sp. 'Peltigera malacea cyanobiont' DB3992]
MPMNQNAPGTFKGFGLFVVIGDGDWGLGTGDWGLGTGDWKTTLIQIPNPQSPLPLIPRGDPTFPNPQCPILNFSGEYNHD